MPQTQTPPKLFPLTPEQVRILVGRDTPAR